MSEQKLVSPLLDGFVMGNPMSNHDGIRCCPALKENSDEKYIVKIISVPESQIQLDALLLTGAYKDPADAMDYFKEVADSIVKEVELLNTLAKLEGFLPYEGCQIVPMEDGKLGYEVYLLSRYKRSLLRYMRKHPVTHLEAVNLGLDLCASLAISRRAGHLYVDLKPSNVFLSKEKQYRIGDMGFVPLESLAYTSLPGKYRSPYAPPEAQDDLKTLNETADTYAVGMILYQIYNEGALPAAPLEPKDPFPHPSNADYEISSIIMKAVDPDPAKRWTDPMEMGQALIAYMQRNTVNNVPIAPPSGVVSIQEDAPSAPESTDSNSEEVAAGISAETAAETTPDVIPVQDTVPAAPETDVPAAEPEQDIPEAPAELPEEEDEDLDFSIAFTGVGEAVEDDEEEIPQEPVRKPMPVRRERNRRSRNIFGLVAVLLVLACIGCGAFWFYQTQYLQTIDNLTLDGTQHELTVTVETKMDMSLLQVSCTDTYGNSAVQPVVNGRAVFTDLLPDSLYRIELSVEGFHALEGKTAEIFTTAALSNVVSISAVTGPEDGSVMVNFTVDGSDPEEWVITCSAPGEEDIVETFTGHSITIKGLTVGKIYTLTLGTSSGDPILGTNTVEFSATRLVMAEKLTIADFADGMLTVRWDAPEDAAVERWTVRCYNDDGHEETLEISDTEITFTGIDPSKAYTVEVTAAGMTEPTRVSVTANPITITGFTVDDSDLDQLTVSWTHDGQTPEGGWLLMYTVDGMEDQSNVVKCQEASAVIETRIPSAAYRFSIQAADSTSVFNNIQTYTCPNAAVYSNQGLSANNLTAYLLKTPEEEDWTIESVGDDAITDTFQSGDSISLVLKAADNFYLPEMDVEVMYVIRNGDGNVLVQFISRETIDWKALWYDDDYHNGELTIPKVPTEPGDYSVSVYFDNLAVTAITFSITE